VKTISFIGLVLISINALAQSNLKQTADTFLLQSSDTASKNITAGKIFYDTIIIPICSNKKGSEVTYEKIIRPKRDTAEIKQKVIIVSNKKEN
jgi:hypothetical protein